MLRGLVTLYDVDGGGIYLADEDGLSLRRMAVGTDDIALDSRTRSRSATAPSAGRRSSGARSSCRAPAARAPGP